MFIRFYQRLRLALGTKAARGSGALLSAQWFATAVGLCTTALVARALGAPGFGAASLAIAFPSIVWSATSLKPVSLLTRSLARAQQSGANAEFVRYCWLGYILDVATGAVAATILLITAGGVASYLGIPELTPAIRIYSALLLVSTLSSTNQAVLSTEGRFSTIARIRILRSFLLLGFSLIAIAADAGPAGYVVAVGVSQSVCTLGELGLAAALIRAKRAGFAFDRKAFTDLVPLWMQLRGSFAWNYLLSTVAGFCDQLPLLLLGRFAGPTDVAYFRLATSIVAVATVPEASLARVVHPKLAASWVSLKRSEVRERLIGWTRGPGVAIGSLLIVATLIAPFAIEGVFGAQYSAMSRGVQFLMLAVALRAIIFWIEPAIYASDRIQHWTAFHAAQLLVTASLGIWVAATFGFFGMALLVAVLRTAVIVAGVSSVFQSWGRRGWRPTEHSAVEM